MNEDRFVDIEIRLTYQEETIRELNKVVCEQQKQIDQLEKSVKKMTEQLKEVAEATGAKIPNEKPPHY
jgi:SlyX protein